MGLTTWQPVNLAFRRPDDSGIIDFLQVKARASHKIPVAITPKLIRHWRIGDIPTTSSPPYFLTHTKTGATMSWPLYSLQKARELLASYEETSRKLGLTWDDHYMTKYGSWALPEKYSKLWRRLG